MDILIEYLPFIIPVFIAEVALLIIALKHALTHNTYKIGSKVIWVIIILCINFIGPILYLTIGRSDE